MKPATRDLDALGGRLDDYLRRSMPDDEASEYEADLFERALVERAPELVFRSELGATLRAMNRRGTLELWLTSAGVEELRSAPGVRVVVTDFDIANPTPPEIPADADLVVTRIAADLRGVSRLEAEVLSPDGRLLKKMPDVIFDPEDGAVYACCEAELARTAAGTQGTITRLYAVEESGRRLFLVLPGF